MDSVIQSMMYKLLPSRLLSQNPRREVERIMNYLDLSLSDEVISRIVELTSFEIMKENPMANYSCIPTHVFDNSVSPFMRKGASVNLKPYIDHNNNNKGMSKSEHVTPFFMYYSNF